MTFDARGTNSSQKGNSLVFGAITTTVVAGAFFAVLCLPQPSGQSIVAEQPRETPIVQTVQHASPAAISLSGKSARNLLATLTRIDPAAGQNLSAALAGAEENTYADIIKSHVGLALNAHSEELSLADTRHVDIWLDMTRQTLRQADRTDNPWCSGPRYAGLTNADFSQPDAIRQGFTGLSAQLTEYTFDSATLMLLAIEDARANPVERSGLTPTDEAAMQGVVMSLVSDPQILPLLMASQSGALPEDTLRSVNVCELGVTAVTALKTLPQETKGRVFAEFIKTADFEAGNLDGMDALPTF